uniref:N-terminal EF-hand calcium binding protein 3 n=1 Tax=Sphaeramia orbicularis TaxID=375764 RepID=A0A673AUV4_9TELE
SFRSEVMTSVVKKAPAEQMVFKFAGLLNQPSLFSLCLSDDGKLSFEEFNAYFADGILTTEELQELKFIVIMLETEKNEENHLGEYLNVLSSLESLNIAILKAMDKTKEEYQGSSVLGQFVTRFMLRETSSQLLSLQRSLQCAMDAVEEQSSPAPNCLHTLPETCASVPQIFG